MGEQIWNLLAVIGGIYVGFWARGIVQKWWVSYKAKKARRQAQKSRLNSYRHGYNKKPLSIAKEYAAELQPSKEEQVGGYKPLRIATGLYSDAAAQKYLI